jgi:RNA polymerase subunit RPABC4/transcription elongation factor Spt4
MHPEIACPRCGSPVNPNIPTCPNCGINLTLAAIIVTEESIAATHLEPSGAPITPEILVPRLGEILLGKNVIRQSDLHRALDVSKKLNSENRPRLLGQILLDLIN